MLDVKELLTKILANTTPIIKCNYSTSKSVANQTDTYQDGYTATKKGVFIGFVHVAYPSNTTGRRATRCYTLSGGTRTYNNSTDSRSPANGTNTDVSVPICQALTAGQTLGVRVWQNSGSSQTVYFDFHGLFITNL